MAIALFNKKQCVEGGTEERDKVMGTFNQPIVCLFLTCSKYLSVYYVFLFKATILYNKKRVGKMPLLSS